MLNRTKIIKAEKNEIGIEWFGAALLKPFVKLA